MITCYFGNINFDKNRIKAVLCITFEAILGKVQYYSAFSTFALKIKAKSLIISQLKKFGWCELLNF